MLNSGAERVSRLVLDTSAYSHFRCGHAGVLDDFLAEPFVDLLDTTASVARQYGRVFSKLKRAGTPLPVNDIWITATTIDCGGTLLTFDRDFNRVPGLDLLLRTAE